MKKLYLLRRIKYLQTIKTNGKTTNITLLIFADRNRDEVKILIAGQEGHICENCVEHAQEIITQEIFPTPEKNSNLQIISFR